MKEKTKKEKKEKTEKESKIKKGDEPIIGIISLLLYSTS